MDNVFFGSTSWYTGHLSWRDWWAAQISRNRWYSLVRFSILLCGYLKTYPICVTYHTQKTPFTSLNNAPTWNHKEKHKYWDRFTEKCKDSLYHYIKNNQHKLHPQSCSRLTSVISMLNVMDLVKNSYACSLNMLGWLHMMYPIFP